MNKNAIAALVMAWSASLAGAAGVEQTPQQGQDEGITVAQRYDEPRRDRYDGYDRRDRRDHGDRPPPEWARHRPPPPHRDAEWVPGHWERHRGIDEWVPGQWEYRQRRYPHHPHDGGYRPVR